MTEGTIRIMIVDDHTLIREGLASLLNKDSRIVVVAEASTAEEAVEMVGRIACDVAVVDLSLPRQDGVWCTQTLKAAKPELGVLIHTMHRDDARVRAALEAGANGYILKTARRDEIVSAITTVHEGSSYLHHSVARIVLGSLSTRPPNALAVQLSEREIKILDQVVAGSTNKEIGEHLFVSVAMVKKHLSHLYRKFGVEDRTQLVTAAFERGIVKPPGSLGDNPGWD